MKSWISRMARTLRVQQAEANTALFRLRSFARRFKGWRLARPGLAGMVAALCAAQLGMAAPMSGGAGNDTTSTTLSNDAVSAYIADKTLTLAEKMVRMEQLSDKASLPQKSSKTFQYTRYERLNLPQAPLVEGITPDATQMSTTTVTATVEQWGQVVVITDMANLVIKHPVTQKAVALLALAAAETRDREIQETLLAGTNIQYANGRSSRATLVTGDVLTTNEIRKTVANLRNNGARTFGSEGRMVGVFDPSVEMDVTADPTFVAASQYSKVENLLNGEVGRWMGVRWMESNFLYTYTGVAAASAADVSGAGTINQTTQVFFVVTAVNNTTGFEELVYQQSSVTTATDAVNTHAIRVTMPATSGYTYSVYAGTTTGVTYQVTTGVAPSATYDITSVPTSGTQNPAVPATGVTSHNVWVMGQEAFTTVTLDSMSLQSYMTPPGPSDSDPLAQRRKAGWKMAFKAVICNNNFMRRIECVSAY